MMTSDNRIHKLVDEFGWFEKYAKIYSGYVSVTE